MRRLDAQGNVDKASAVAIVANALQITLMLSVALYILLTDSLHWDAWMIRAAVLSACFVVSIGAAYDIRDAVSTRRILRQVDDMNQTMTNMETLNNTLRAQRHDFLNHLQVVYSLMEMGETGEANAYIEKVYGAITSVSRVMKTASPAINALLQVKASACQEKHVKLTLDITSAWKELPMPHWEMCKVLGNLIDNALDALEEVEDRQLTVKLTEDLHAYRFSVSNNGPMIPKASRQHIFMPGVTTKSAGHGMGLYIVRKTLNANGGDIELTSDAARTCFSGWVPKQKAAAADRRDNQ